MPKHYSALKMHMGVWDYYVVKMRMGEVAREIQFSKDVEDNPTISTQLQRILESNRGPKIINYLQTNEQRFFSAIVVAALEGKPRWFPIEIKDQPQFEMVGEDIKDSMGILMFSDSLKTYALDGQHRLYAIKQLIDGHEEPPPGGFSEETISVVFIVPPDDFDSDEFRKAYRRLFSSLNRHAKPTKKNINIIMDEDDRFAILTRRVIMDMEFFYWDGEEGTVGKVDTEKPGKNLSPTSTAFTTIISLYEMNVHLAWNTEMTSEHGTPLKGHGWDVLIQKTPEDNEVDELYEGLSRIWDGIFLTFPELGEEPISMRKHEHDYGDGEHDHLLFHPIGQDRILAPLVRLLLDDAQITHPDSGEQVAEVLKPLRLVPWDLKHNLWRNLLIYPNPDTAKWRMRDNNQKECLDLSFSILMWLVGLANLSVEQIAEMRDRWAALVLPAQPDHRDVQTFEELQNIRERIMQL